MTAYNFVTTPGLFCGGGRYLPLHIGFAYYTLGVCYVSMNMWAFPAKAEEASTFLKVLEDGGSLPFSKRKFQTIL